MDITGSITTAGGVSERTAWRPLTADLRPPPGRHNGAVGDGHDPVSRALTEVIRRMRPVSSVTGVVSRPDPALQPRHGLSAHQITRVLAHISSHFDGIIHNHELAAHAHLSSSHFCRVFRNTFGTSPHRYITLTRIECAKLLMRDTGASLGHIAAECGMADQAHFNRLFRRFVGTSPGAWRRDELA